jgi:lipopolysaccharide biosynthesis regulator YciM
MAKNNDTGENVLKGLAVLGGGYLFVELIKMLSKQKTFYTCTRCKYDKLEFGQHTCPNCQSKLQWPNQN